MQVRGNRSMLFNPGLKLSVSILVTSERTFLSLRIFGVAYGMLRTVSRRATLRYGLCVLLKAAKLICSAEVHRWPLSALAVQFEAP